MACLLTRAHVLLFCWLLFSPSFRCFQCHACKKLESGSIFFCGCLGEVISARGCSQLWPWLTTTSLARPCLPRRARCFSRRALQGSAAPFWGECQPAAHVCHLRTSSAVFLSWLVHAAVNMQAAPETQASGWRETLCWAYGQVSGTREGRCGLVYCPPTRFALESCGASRDLVYMIL